MEKKYVSLSRLKTFLDNIKNNFAPFSHSHTVSEITDFTMSDSYTKTEIDNYEFITVEDIDAICGVSLTKVSYVDEVF